ncbi:unnamed protein product [Prorocentrum cordatum]|uniref:Uncharacterized protein n=1 Tax=Prorocentrum cordatum TaxID=2364126 RepID=A0ABN9U021_9DINO|nr:unnamed protein product [Polarella glacialis]
MRSAAASSTGSRCCLHARLRRSSKRWPVRRPRGAHHVLLPRLPRSLARRRLLPSLPPVLMTLTGGFGYEVSDSPVFTQMDFSRAMGFKFQSSSGPYRVRRFSDAGGTPGAASVALAAGRVSRRALRSRHRPLLAMHAESAVEEDFTLVSAFLERVKDDLPRVGKIFSDNVAADGEATLHVNGSDQDDDEYVALRGGCSAADVAGGGVGSAISTADVDGPSTSLVYLIMPRAWLPQRTVWRMAMLRVSWRVPPASDTDLLKPRTARLGFSMVSLSERRCVFPTLLCISPPPCS